MGRYRKKNRDLIDLRRLVHEVAQDTFYARGDYLPPVPEKKAFKKKSGRLKIPIKIVTKKQLLELMGDNDN